MPCIRELAVQAGSEYEILLVCHDLNSRPFELSNGVFCSELMYSVMFEALAVLDYFLD